MGHVICRSYRRCVTNCFCHLTLYFLPLPSSGKMLFHNLACCLCHNMLRGPSSPEIPEISKLSWNLKLSWKLIHLVRMSWCWPLMWHSMWPFTVASIVTVRCSMCNITLVTFLWLQYWSAWLICIFYVLSLLRPKNVLKFTKNLVMKFQFLLLGPLQVLVIVNWRYCLQTQLFSSAHSWLFLTTRN